MPKGKRTSSAAMLLKGGADVKFSQKGGKKERKKERKKEKKKKRRKEGRSEGEDSEAGS